MYTLCRKAAPAKAAAAAAPGPVLDGVVAMVSFSSLHPPYYKQQPLSPSYI